jgi:hypothetical protein
MSGVVQQVTNQPVTYFLGITYWIAVVAQTSILIWGVRLISRELQRDVGGGRTFLALALSEKVEPGVGGSELPSFSRVAGALGGVGIAASFVGIGYWILQQLFFAGDLSKISQLHLYFAAGAALFLPYAFNQLSSIFKT